MEVKIVTNEKNILELELVGADQSLAQLIAMKLNEENDVDFASYKVDHPILSHPVLYVRTKKGDPSKLVLSVVASLKKNIENFKKQFTDISG